MRSRNPGQSDSQLPQPDGGQPAPTVLIARVMDASYAQALSDLGEHQPIVDVDGLFRGNLDQVEGYAKDLFVRLAMMDEARAHEAVDEAGQPEGLDPLQSQLAAFVAHRGDLEPMLGLEFSDQLDHLRSCVRLGEHESLELFR